MEQHHTQNRFIIKLCSKDFLNPKDTILKVSSENLLFLKAIFYVLYIRARLT